MRKQILIAAAAAGFLGLGTGVAAAFPAPQPLDRLATVQTVAGGCGIGWHRGPWGGCRGNGAVYVAPPVYVAPRPVVVAPGPVVVAPVRHCWWRAGPYGSVRVCN